MPELPDVETYKRYLDATSLRQKIENVDVEDARLLAGTTTRKLARALAHHRFERTHRHGKYLFAGLDSGQWLMMHFGLSGRLAYFKRTADTPPYTQVLIHFTNGSHLAYVEPRKLGRLALTDGPPQFVDRHRLGPDALTLGLREFLALADDRRGNIKSCLLDQHAIAGIGNVYGDEILFHARLHPQRMVRGLSKRDLRLLHRKLQYVLRRAIAVRADPVAMPRTWLLPHRRKGGHCPRCKAQLRQATIGGRPSYYCPRCQSMAPRP